MPIIFNVTLLFIIFFLSDCDYTPSSDEESSDSADRCRYQHAGTTKHSRQLPQDLVSLCDSLAIPRDYHAFYHSLPHCSKMRDALTEPDELEESDNEN